MVLYIVAIYFIEIIGNNVFVYTRFYLAGTLIVH
jgi:hypothetical protein